MNQTDYDSFEDNKCEYNPAILFYNKKYKNDSSFVFASYLNHIIILRKCPDTITDEDKHVIFPKYAKYYANKLKVILIIDKMSGKKINELVSRHVTYKLNDTLINEKNQLTYYKTIKRAFYEDLLKYNTHYTGICKYWLDNGYSFSTTEYLNGKSTGKYEALWKKCAEYSKKFNV